MIELMKTEKEYIANLSPVFEGYMAAIEDPKVMNCHIPVPEDLTINSEKYKLIFLNIKLIYEWHKELVTLPVFDSFGNHIAHCHIVDSL